MAFSNTSAGAVTSPVRKVGLWIAFTCTVGTPMAANAACPAGDPSVLYCDDFTTSSLADYTVINPLPGNASFNITIANGVLTFAVVPNTGLAFARVLSKPVRFKDTLFETDLNQETPNPSLRSGPGMEWTTLDLNTLRFGFALQLDEQSANFYLGVEGQFRDLRTYYAIHANQTYRLALKVTEIAGVSRPKVYSFTGYIDGTEIFSTTDEALGLDMSGSPTEAYPGFAGGSYSYSAMSQVFDNAIVTDLRPRLACAGFDPPIGSSPVAVNKNRALPFKATLTNEQGAVVTNLGDAPPVIQVTYAPVSGTPVDVTAFAVPAGLGTPGNQFVYADGKWQFNLLTKSYAAAGTYTVSMVSGDSYLIEPACTGSFVIR